VEFMKNPFLTNIALAGDGHTPSQEKPADPNQWLPMSESP